MKSKYASVIIEGGVPTPLDYAIPDTLDIAPGMRVEVPLRNHLRTGVVCELKEKGFKGAHPIASILPLGLPPDLIELAKWLSRYTLTPLPIVLRTMLPTSVRKSEAKTQLIVEPATTREELRAACAAMQNKSPAQARTLEAVLAGKKGMFLTEVCEAAQVSRSSIEALVEKKLLTVKKIAVNRSPLADQEYFPSKPKTLNAEQKTALDAIQLGTFKTHLLHGITGSGKTEVYLQAIQQALDKALGVIMLVPEISLTPQTLERFRSRFEGKIAILHHRLSEGERRDEWVRIHKGEAQIVIGPRSAIFSPMPKLGLIIVDEEQENSYKQTDSAPCYHARDVAVMRGKMTDSVVILGSATPSLESLLNAQLGKYHLSTLSLRADNAKMPTIETIESKQLLSDPLLNEIGKRFEVGEQSLLFLTRRRSHSMLFCEMCKSTVKCPNCELSLTFHRGANRLACHLCDYTLQPPKTCPECKQAEPLSFRGAGTEQVERAIRAIFPDIRTLRVDADTTRHKGSHERLLRGFRSGKADILIGTQMIAKGLHFPQVTLVGILNADYALHIPDFRASENLFNLLTQVAGRSGRGALPGKVLIQARMPDHPIIRLAATQQFETFTAQELAARKQFNYPPYTHLIKLTFSGENQQQTENCAKHLHTTLSCRLPDLFPVTPCGYPKIQNRYRFQFLVRGQSVYTMNREIAGALKPLPKGIRLQIDVDPTSTYF